MGLSTWSSRKYQIGIRCQALVNDGTTEHRMSHFSSANESSEQGRTIA